MASLLDSPRLLEAQEKILRWLGSGISPQKLAFTLAMGAAIGCVPMLGVASVICVMVALALRLNLAVIQAGNYLAWPLQFILLVPFLKMGQRLFPSDHFVLTPEAIVAQLQLSPWKTTEQMLALFEHGLVAWLVCSVPAVAVLTLALTPLMAKMGELIRRPRIVEPGAIRRS